MSRYNDNWIPAEKVIPHRYPFRMLDCVKLDGPDNAIGTVVLADDSMAISDKKVLEPALIECVAQTAAGMEGLQCSSSNDIKQGGMLCGIHEFHVFRQLETGTQLRVRVHVEKRLGSMFLIKGEVFCDEGLVAMGHLKIYAGN